MSTMLDLVSGSGTIKEETSAEVKKLAVLIDEKGKMFLKNDGILPMARSRR